MKEFNITGLCYPDDCFMVDTSDKIEKILDLIYKKKYFVINRPRQYGKTTTMTLLELRLLKSDEYLPIFISFESLDSTAYVSPETFGRMFLQLLGEEPNIEENGYSDLFYDSLKHIQNFKSLSTELKNILSKIDKKIVLMIDEVDKSCDNQIFLHFLGMLRDKYLKAQRRKDVTFHNVILAGVTDIKNMKLKIRPEAEKKLNSPWNVAIDFEVNMSFSPIEIETMLDDYSTTKNIQMEIKNISERLHFWTSGYPFLVSKLCKIIDEKLLPTRDQKIWEEKDVDQAANLLLGETNTIFDDIGKNLQNNKQLFEYMKSLTLGSSDYHYDLTNPIIGIAYMYGFIDKNGDNKVKIHNKIFEEKLTSYFISRNQTDNITNYNKINEPYISNNGHLDLKNILLKFQEAIKEKYSNTDVLKSDEFLEKDLRLLFIMFLKPILNGYGFCFKEVQTGAEKRLDIVIVFKSEKFIVELKLWKGDEAHSAGLAQLKSYMTAESVKEGYMLIMNKNKNKDFKDWDDEGVFCVMI